MNYRPHPDFPDQGPYVPTTCYCKGEYLCDMHRPAPPPPPKGACVLCGRVEPIAQLEEGQRGLKWHRSCASDLESLR